MISPQAAAQRLLWSLAIGAALGLLYGSLRPLRPKWTAICDLIFVIGVFLGWLYVAFAVCGGDMRFALLLAMAAGGVLFDMTVGRLLRPVFRGFWGLLGKIWGILWFPLGKILKKLKNFRKILLAFGKKWVTIGWNSRPRMGRRSGGKPNGKEKKGNQTGAA